MPAGTHLGCTPQGSTTESSPAEADVEAGPTPVCMLSLHRGHANLCIAPILVHVLLKRGPSSAGLSQVTLGRFLNLALVISETERLMIQIPQVSWEDYMS